MSARRAFSIAETAVAVAVAALVIGLAWGLVRLCARGTAAPERLADRAALRLLADLIVEDVMQLGMAEDQDRPVKADDESFSFRRARFTPTAIELATVSYRYQRGRLLRTEPGQPPAELARVPLTACRFACVDNPRTHGSYLLLYLVSGAAELSQLVPLPEPPARGNPALAACTLAIAHDRW